MGEFAEGNSIDVTLRRGDSGGCLRGELGTVGFGGGGKVELRSKAGGGGSSTVAAPGMGGELFLRDCIGEPVPLLPLSGEEAPVGRGCPP